MVDSNISQSRFPSVSLKSSAAVAKALYKKFGCNNTAPHDMAKAIAYSPASEEWRLLCVAAIAYGLMESDYDSNEMRITDLGRRVVASSASGERFSALKEAALQPQIMRDFFEKYDAQSFPDTASSEQYLIELGMTEAQARRGVDILRDNGVVAGLVREYSEGMLVSLESVFPEPEVEEQDIAKPSIMKDTAHKDAKGMENNKVYISHGGKRHIVDELKELLMFDKFEPIISVESEPKTPSELERAFNNMRACFSAVIHVGADNGVVAPEGGGYHRLNENTLIEIGMAIALFGNKFVLLAQKDIKLPPSLRSMVRCEYEDDNLDYEATMKLLKTFIQFKQPPVPGQS